MPSVAARPSCLAALAVAAVLALSGCGTVSRADCQAGDWYAIGVADGEAGHPAARIDEHAKSCARYDLPVDRAGYADGREAGLRRYCTPASGFANGVAGNPYANVCAGEAGAGFVTAYGIGADVYRARSIARDLAAEARSIRADRERAEDRIDDLRSRMAGASPEERERLRDRIEDIRFGMLGSMGEQITAARRADEAAREADAVEWSARAAFTRLFAVPPP
ncbi:DUF2799 domain-containing protein [Mongoliimonas terrestris]|uniref:DUF2799 domain-containing protein n=1 Tax=Mongoliimonas terrestris TaxID=1709001 RepID=UPI0009499C32|nr:DUF2799 domain-containing protein [Mongoliimonas terrestris]